MNYIEESWGGITITRHENVEINVSVEPPSEAKKPSTDDKLDALGQALSVLLADKTGTGVQESLQKLRDLGIADSSTVAEVEAV